MSEQTSLYKRISLVFLHQYPGQVYLRFDPHNKAPAMMVRVMPADIVAISRLAEPDPDGGRITVVEQYGTIDELDSSGVTEQYINTDDDIADDDFQPGDSG